MKRAAHGITIVLTSIALQVAVLQRHSQADLVLSLDASNPDFVTVDGTNVTEWRQEFGANAYIPFTLDPAGSASEAPTYNPSGLNGMGTVDFFSAEFDFMLADIGLLIGGNTDEYSIFFVADAMGGNGTPFSQQAFSTGGLSFRNVAFWTMRIGGSAGGPEANGFFGSGDPTNSGFKVRSVIGDATSVTWDIAGSASVISDTDHAIASPGFFTLGNRFSPFNHPADVSIAQLAIFDTTLDQDTRTGINSILADKWGLPAISATQQQIDLGMAALTQPAAEPPPPPIAIYEFTDGATSGAIESVNSTDDEPNSIAGEWTTGGSTLVSTCCGNPDRGAFFGGGWRSIGEIGPEVPSTVSSYAPEEDQTPTVDEDYFGFTVSPDEGFQMDMTTIAFDLQRDSIDGNDSWGLYVDEDPGPGGDNFTTKLGGETGADVPPGGVRDYNNFQIDISEFSFLQNVTDATTFRLYFWHDGEFSNDVWLADEQAEMGGTELNRTNSRLDNVALYGVVEEIGDGLPGDYNGDGMVDAADYIVWRDNRGATDETAINGNGDGTNGVDQADYDLWHANFGNTSSGAGTGSVNVPVPEPGILTLLLSTIHATLLVRGRKPSWQFSWRRSVPVVVPSIADNFGERKWTLWKIGFSTTEFSTTVPE